MPRPKTPVKIKSLGAVDIHFHGAFGTDLVTASDAELDALAARLRDEGVAAFCPTTLSMPWKDLTRAVGALGKWTAHRQRALSGGAVPLGIHLEGPYLSPNACGAHPPGAIRPLNLSELDTLWELSQRQLRILTIAPEPLSPTQLKGLCAWARKRQVTLSLGHSRATEAQATRAFESGFTSVTHGWNALGFQTRSPGVMGAALGRKGVSIELILDQVHVSPTVMSWTRELHGDHPLCFVSDCVPAAATRAGSWHRFGGLKIRQSEGACRLANGTLAGGGVLLPRAFRNWVLTQAQRTGLPTDQVLRREISGLCEAPLRSIGMDPRRAIRDYQLGSLEWRVGSDVSFRVL